MSTKIALYISTSKLSQDQQSQIQHEFDTAQDEPSVDPQPGYIEPVPAQEWAIGLSPEEIFQRHKPQRPEQYAEEPIVILDDRTVEDGTVLVVVTAVDDETEAEETRALRFVAGRVPLAAANLEIENMTIDEYEESVDDDGVWRGFGEGAED